MPKVPSVPVPNLDMDIPFVPKKGNKTSYSMNHTNEEHATMNIYGDDDDEEALRRPKENNDQARHDRTWEEKEKEESFELEEDLYSLLYLARPFSLTVAVTIAVFFLQMFILILIFADLTDGAPVHKEVVLFPLEVPINVPTIVAVAQCVSLFVATIKEEDIFVSLKAVIVVGHDERVSVRFPGATPFKWWLANTLRFLTGLLNVVVSFFFIVGSSTVLDIFESFAAVEFVSYIDNMVFRLAKWGYLGKTLQRMTIKVESVQMENRREKGRWWAVLVVVFLSLTLIPLLALWTKVHIAQSSGFYLEKAVSPRLLVRFGDDELKVPKTTIFGLNGTTRDLSSFDSSVRLEYAFFSGSYEIAHEDDKLYRHNDRPIYIERDANKGRNDTSYSFFYYCAEQSTWVFTNLGLGTARQGNETCKWGWLAVSEVTEEYALEKVSDAWSVWTGVISQSTVKIASDSCELPSDCSLNGKCTENKVCECNEGWQGRHCNVEAPFCPALVFVNYGKNSYEYSYEGPFELLTRTPGDGSPILVYERPVYFRKTIVEQSVCGSGERYELYLYAGQRFFLTYWCRETLQRYFVDDRFQLEENLHAYWDNVLGLELKRFSDVTNSYSGTGLQMLEVRDSYSTGSQTAFGIYIVSEGAFECINVPCEDDSSVCGRKGTCEKYEFESTVSGTTTTLHKCSCSDFYGGIYCQFNPHGSYTREHFKEFQANATAGLLQPPSDFEYQSRYWEPLIASGATVNVTADDQVNNESERDVNVVNQTAAEPNEPIAEPGNVFGNQSRTPDAGGAGEL